MKKGVAIGLAIIALLIVASYVFFSSSGNEPKDLVSDDVTITGKVTLTQRPLTLSELASGVSLDAYSNQIIWSDELSENLSINDAFGSILDNVLFVYDYTFQTYWFNPQGSYASYNNHSYYSQRLYDSIVPGHQYFIYMVKDDVLMYTFCSDSDGGLDPFVFGSVDSSIDGYFEDRCYNINQVQEYACNDNDENYGRAVSVIIDCDYGCSNGACIKDSGSSSGDVTYQGVLDMLNSCRIVSSGASTKNGNEVCHERSFGTCISGQTLAPLYLQNYSIPGASLFAPDFFTTEGLLECGQTPDELLNDLLSNPWFNSAEARQGGLSLEAQWICCSAPANECSVDADCAPEETYYCSSDGTKACLSSATKDWQCINNQCSTTIVQEDAGCTVCQNGCSSGACVSENWVPVDLSVVRIDPQDSELKIGDQVIEYTIYQGEIESVSVPYYDPFNFSVKTIDLYSNSGSGSLIFGDANVLSIKSSGYSIEVAGSKVYEVFLHYDGSHIDLYTRDTDGDFTPVGRVRLEYNDASSASVGILKLLI